MKRLLLFLIATSLCISCLDYNNQKVENKDWVYLEIQTILKTDTTLNYIYGQMKESITYRIDRNSNSKGLFFLENARYINDDDLLQVYEDRNDKGVLVYRIENIQRIEFFKKDPILFFEKEKLDKTALKVLKSYAQE